MTSCNYSLANRTFPTVWDTLVVQTMPVETETCLKICQLEFRATKIAEALLAAEPDWQCSQALIGGGVRRLTPLINVYL